MEEEGKRGGGGSCQKAGVVVRLQGNKPLGPVHGWQGEKRAVALEKSLLLRPELGAAWDDPCPAQAPQVVSLGSLLQRAA